MHLKKIIFFISFFFYSLNFLSATELKLGTVSIKNKNLLFHVEIADTKKMREKGLMFRTDLEVDKGMLIVMPEAKFASIWMKNTFLSLDIIFISEENFIVDYLIDAVPLSKKTYTSKIIAKYILEINAGLIKKLGINGGDKVHIEY